MQIKCGYKSINGDYIFAKVSEEVEKYKQSHPNEIVIDLGVGDVKLPPVNEISAKILAESAKFTTQSGFCGYPNERGILPLRQTIANYYKERGADISSEEIFITTGAKPAIGEIFELCDFKNAAIVTPTYPLYEELCSLFNVKMQFIEYGTGGKIELPKQRVDVVFLCSPNNPTGKNLSEEALEKYLNYAKKNDSLVILDGAYADFAKNYRCPYLLKGSENIVEVRSYSKNLCFTGLRLGYVVIKKENPLREAYERYLSLRSNGVNVIMQRAAMISYSKRAKEQVEQRIEYYRENARILKRVFYKFGLKCSGGTNAPYLLLSVNENGTQFFKRLLEKEGVAVTPGEAFRANNCVRVSCLAKRETVIEGAKRIFKFFDEK